jgi:vacuolar-type H+-ATPase subunit H
MDRIPNDNYGSTGGSSGELGSTPGTGATGTGYGAGQTGAGSTSGANFGQTSGATGTDYSDAGSTGTRDLGDKARDARDTAKEKLGNAREAASEKLEQARGKAHELKNSFADKLDSGADRLRGRANQFGDGPAYATGEGASAISTTDSATSRVGDKVAGGMHSTADWLRNNDLDSMKNGVEEQVRSNPGRALLVAAVAGYLIGKVIRR